MKCAATMFIFLFFSAGYQTLNAQTLTVGDETIVSRERSTERGLSSENSEELRIVLQLFKKINNAESEIRDKDILTRTDRYAVAFTPEKNAYVYVFQADSKKIISLFPNPEYSDENNPHESGESCRIPDAGKWITLDGCQGEQHIILLAYPEPLIDPLSICKLLLNGNLTLNKERGTAAKKTGLPDGHQIIDIDKLFIDQRCFIHK